MIRPAPPRLLRRLFLVACLVAAGGSCRRETIHLELGGLELPLGIFVFLDDAQQPIRVSAPFSVSQGNLQIGDPQIGSLRQGEDDLWLVATSTEALADLEADVERLAELEVTLGPAPAACPAGLFSTDLRTVQNAWPTTAAWRVNISSDPAALEPIALPTSVASQLTFRALVDPTPCPMPTAPGASAQPFGREYTQLRQNETLAGERIVPDEEGKLDWISTLSRVRWVDRDRVLGSTSRAVVLFERGAQFDDGPGRTVGLDADDVAADLSVQSIILEPPSQRQGAEIRAFVAAATKHEAEGGAIFDIAVGASGLRRTGTATRTAEDWFDLAFDDRDRLLAAGSRGRVLVRERGSFRVVVTGVADTLVRILPLPSQADELRWVLGSANGAVYLFGPEGLEETRLSNSVELVRMVRGIARAGEDIWISTTSGTLFRRRGSGTSWERVELRGLPGLVECYSAVDACGRPPFTPSFEGLLVPTGGRFVVFNPFRCSAAVSVRLADRCASPINLRGDLRLERHPDGTTIDELDGRLIFGGRDGLLSELELTGR